MPTPTRVSGWNDDALAEIKSFVNKYNRLLDSELPLHSDAFWSAAAHRPQFRATAARLFGKGLQERTNLEYHLGDEIGQN